MSGSASGPVADAGVARTQPGLALPLRRDADEGFPAAGAAMLVVLLVAAVALVWFGRRRGIAPGARAGSLWSRFARPAPGGAAGLAVQAVLQVEPGLRLVVVDWEGGRLLLGVGTGSAPVVLDRTAAQPRDPAGDAEASR